MIQPSRDRQLSRTFFRRLSGKISPMTRRAASPHVPAQTVRSLLRETCPEDTFRVAGGTAHLRMPAILDAGTAKDLRQLLTVPHEGYRELVLDCSDIELVKACAVTLLVALRRRCASRGVELKLTRLSPPAREFLVITGLHRIIHAFDSRNEVATTAKTAGPHAA